MTKIFKTTHKIRHLICENHLEHKSCAMLQSSLLFIQNISPFLIGCNSSAQLFFITNWCLPYLEDTTLSMGLMAWEPT